MMRRAGDRRELERRILRAMKAKGISFRGLATETGLPPFTIAAALLGQVSLPNYTLSSMSLVVIPVARVTTHNLPKLFAL